MVNKLNRLFISGIAITLTFIPIPLKPEQLGSNLDFSGTGLNNRRTPGVSKHPSCPPVEADLTAIVPQEMGLTVGDLPTFWFYIPYSYRLVEEAEFVLLDQNREREIYRLNLRLSQTPGIINVTLPENGSEKLKNEQIYAWSLTIFCNQDSTDANIFVEGYIKRVTVNANLESYSDYANQKIWYEAISNLAQKMRQEPSNPDFKQDWIYLLRNVGLDGLVDQPILDCCSIELSSFYYIQLPKRIKPAQK
jgi:hypothetical protein